MSVDTVLQTIKQALENAISEQENKYKGKISNLEQQLADLQSYKDVSLVNKLTVQVDQLQRENLQLKKRLRNANGGANPLSGTQSMYSTPTIQPKIAPKVKPVVHKKPEPVVEPEPVAEPEPEEEPVPEPEEEPVPEPEEEPVPEPEEEPVPEPEEEPVAEPEEEPVAEPEPEEEPVPEPDEEPELDLFLVDNLISGQYFWEPESGNLYEKLNDEEAGEVVGKIKTIKVKNKYYYQDTIDGHVYEYIEDTGDIGDKCGRIVNGKFIKN